MASWQRITAPVLKLIAEYGLIRQRFGGEPDEYQRRLGSFLTAQVVDIPNAGHNVQHDQPALVAEAIEAFLGKRLSRNRCAPSLTSKTTNAAGCSRSPGCTTTTCPP